MSKIGFIGLGIMGRPMANHLLEAGHELVTVKRNKPLASELADNACTATQVADQRRSE